MSGNEDFPKYIKCIQYKVAIATAFAIIKSKPVQTSLDDHFKKIKEKCCSEWHNEDIKSPFESKIIQYLKSNVINEIITLIPKNDTSLKSCYSNKDSSEVLEHSEFVKMITNLKLISDSNNKISLELFGIKDKEVDHKKINRNSHLFCGLFRPIAYSSKTEYIVKKCLRSIFKYLEHFIFMKTNETFENWKGSKLENIVENIKRSSTNPICSLIIKNLVKKGLKLIWTSKVEIFSIEYLIIIFNEICVTKDICCQIISILAEYVDLITKSDVRAHFYVKIPYFLKLMVRLLKRLVKIKKAAIEIGEENIEDIRNLNYWRERCTKLALFCTQNYPLMNKRVWDLIKILIILEKK